MVVLLWIVSVAVAARLGRRKHRRGVVYGVFLSWIGVAVLLLIPSGQPHEDVRGAGWDETHEPSDEAFFENMQYYSRH